MSLLGLGQTSNFSLGEPISNLGRSKLSFKRSSVGSDVEFRTHRTNRLRAKSIVNKFSPKQG